MFRELLMIFPASLLRRLNGNRMSISVDAYWMQKAYELALKAKENNEVPVGAVIVNEDNQLIGEGYNQVIMQLDPTAHAEILAIKQAARTVKNYRLPQPGRRLDHGPTMYVTLEPCCMCAGALVHARINRIVFATRDLQAGAAGSAYNLLQGYPLNHKVQIDEGIMQQQCSQLLQDFFHSRRDLLP